MNNREQQNLKINTKSQRRRNVVIAAEQLSSEHSVGTSKETGAVTKAKGG